MSQQESNNPELTAFLALNSLLGLEVPKTSFKAFSGSIGVFNWFTTRKAARTTLESYIKESEQISDLKGQIEQLAASISLIYGNRLPNPFNMLSVMQGCKNKSKMYLDNGILLSHEPFVTVYGETWFLCNECLLETNLDRFENINNRLTSSALKGYTMSLKANLEAFVFYEYHLKTGLNIKESLQPLIDASIVKESSYRCKLRLMDLAANNAKNKDDFNSFDVYKLADNDSKYKKHTTLALRGKNFAGGHRVLEFNSKDANWIKNQVDMMFLETDNLETIAIQIKVLLELLDLFIAAFNCEYIKVVK